MNKPKLSRKNKKRLRGFLIFLVLIGTPLLTLVLVNVPFVWYFDNETAYQIKTAAATFTKTHQNDAGLFVEPIIETNFRAIDSVNFSIMGSNIVDPDVYPNPYLSNFMNNYLIEKQNTDGSFSDIAGIGSLLSTYQVVKTIDKRDVFLFDSPQNAFRVNGIANFISNSINEGGWGFKGNPLLNDSDIITTYNAIYLANRFSKNFLINDTNIGKFINSTLLPTGVGIGYYLTNYSLSITLESNFYGIRAFQDLGMNYSLIELGLIDLFIFSLYSSIDGGYRDPLSLKSDVQSTYFALVALETLGQSFHDENKTLEFLIQSQNADGGFSQTLNSGSDFKSGWAAIKAIDLLKSKMVLSLAQKNSINQTIIDYYNWMHYFQAFNTLFGSISLQSNYDGVLALKNYAPETFINSLFENYQINSILNYVNACFNLQDYGFGPRPNQNSTLFSTYCALNIIEMLLPYNYEVLGEAIRILSHGGFRAGGDIEYILSLYIPYNEVFLNLIDTNISVVQSTYWALDSLAFLDSLDKIDNVNLTHWVRSCQNADGGFSIYIGFHSDTISTYYGLEIFNELLYQEPMSRISAIEFLKSTQNTDGSFSLLPALGTFLDLPSNFLVTYLASIALYDYNYQPEDIENTLRWYAGCISLTTGGVGDSPGFGGDLRNAPYGIIIIDELKIDQSFNSKPWNQMLFYILLTEAGLIILYVLLKIHQKLSIPQKIKLRLGIGAKITPNYLKQFSAIDCENLSVFVGKKLIVDSVSLNLQHGKILGILGESGAGKSTFIKGLLGMRKLTGFCRIYGLDINKRNARRIRPIYGYVPQDLAKLYLDFTVLENIFYFGNQYGLTEKEIYSRAKRILRNLEIEDKRDEYVRNLSGGQKRRVSIAIGLIHNPIFLILDEPTSGLDPIIRESLWLTLTRINEQFGTTLIVITHYPEESRFCNYVAIFGRNRGMIDYGKPKNLLSQLPGKGRSIEITFKEVIQEAIEKLEAIDGIDKALENKAGTDFSLFTELNIKKLTEEVEKTFGGFVIQQIKQTDARMEQFFRYKAMEVPTIEKF
ncbi:MAG: prenyltransferase/squalene oxidase repeat-containing protein, partial [Promethearchaeota archaeon]